MGQLIHLEELKDSTLARIPVIAISADPIEKTREMVDKAARKSPCMTHRFLSDPEREVIEAYGARNTKGPAAVRPTMVLLNAQGREVWRFTEKAAQMNPSDDELAAAVRRLRRPSRLR